MVLVNKVVWKFGNFVIKKSYFPALLDYHHKRVFSKFPLVCWRDIDPPSLIERLQIAIKNVIEKFFICKSFKIKQINMIWKMQKFQNKANKHDLKLSFHLLYQLVVEYKN